MLLINKLCHQHKIIGFHTKSSPSQCYSNTALSQDEFNTFACPAPCTLDNPYVGRVSISHENSPRKHIWTYSAAGYSENWVHLSTCPCTDSGTSHPAFVDSDLLQISQGHCYLLQWYLNLDWIYSTYSRHTGIEMSYTWPVAGID